MARVSVQSAAAAAAAAFLVLGLLGFVPGVTMHYGRMALAGRGSGSLLFGAFQVSVLHDLIQLAFGVAGLVLAKTVAGARAFLAGGAVVSVALWLLGVAGAGGWIPLDPAGSWAHLALGLVLLALAALTGRGVPAPVAT